MSDQKEVPKLDIEENIRSILRTIYTEWKDVSCLLWQDAVDEYNNRKGQSGENTALDLLRKLKSQRTRITKEVLPLIGKSTECTYDPTGSDNITSDVDVSVLTGKSSGFVKMFNDAFEEAFKKPSAEVYDMNIYGRSYFMILSRRESEIITRKKRQPILNRKVGIEPTVKKQAAKKMVREYQLRKSKYQNTRLPEDEKWLRNYRRPNRKLHYCDAVDDLEDRDNQHVWAFVKLLKYYGKNKNTEKDILSKYAQTCDDKKTDSECEIASPRFTVLIEKARKLLNDLDETDDNMEVRTQNMKYYDQLVLSEKLEQTYSESDDKNKIQ